MAPWFAENGGLGRITTGGTIEQFPVADDGNSPGEVVAGSDGSVWFTENEDGTEQSQAIGRMTVSGSTVIDNVPRGGYAEEIAAGKKGVLWFVERRHEPDHGR